MTEKRFRLDLSKPIFIYSTLIIFVLSFMAINSFNMPSPDYSGVDDLTLYLHNLWSFIMLITFSFAIFLGGYHIALKSKILDLEEKKETRG